MNSYYRRGSVCLSSNYRLFLSQFFFEDIQLVYEEKFDHLGSTVWESSMFLS